VGRCHIFAAFVKQNSNK